MNKNGLRIQEHRKFSKKPSWLNKNKLTKSTLWNRIYYYNTLPKNMTTLPTMKKIKKSLKKHLLNPKYQEGN